MRPYESLRHRADFARVRRRGRRLEAAHVSILAAPSSGGRGPRVAFVTAKSVGGAVERNRTRRRLRAALEGLDLSGRDLILTARPSARTAAFAGLREDIAAALARLRG